MCMMEGPETLPAYEENPVISVNSTYSVRIRLRLLSLSRARRGVATVADYLELLGARRDHAFDVQVGKACAYWFRRVYGREPEQVVTYSREGRPIHVNAYRRGHLGVLAAGYATARRSL